MIKERPILFNSEMVKAILDGSKTQTRRIIKNVGIAPGIGEVLKGSDDIKEWPDYCKFGKICDRLWVRETWRYADWAPFSIDIARVGVEYKADKKRIEHIVNKFDYDKHMNFRPSIHMPRWASRILLEITNVRVDRLQDINEEDAIAEGISRVPFRPDDGFPICDGYMVGKDDGVTSLTNKASKAYKKLWESINGKGSWDINPYVWVVEFKVIK